jgi:hypothetical protein
MKDIDPREAQVRLAEAEKSNQPRRSWRDRLYGRLKVSVRTMDLIIIIAVVLLAATLILGVLTARR